MTLLVPELIPTQRYPFSNLRYMLSHMDVQDGVFGPGDFLVTQRAAGPGMFVDVAPGALWITGDDVARQGLYHLVNDGVITQTISNADVTNPRIDSIFVQINDQSASTRSPSNQASLVYSRGLPTSGATLDNRSGQPATTASVPSSILLADIRVAPGASSILNTSIRDRRPWARRAFASAVLSGAGVLTTASTVQAVLNAGLNLRVECSGLPVRITVNGRFTNAVLQPWMDGAKVANFMDSSWSSGAGDLNYTLTHITTPAAGSHLFQLAWAAITGTASADANTTLNQIIMTVEELPPSANNGIV